MKPVVPRERPDRDIHEATRWYAEEAGAGTARRFLDDLEQAFEQLSSVPSIGSPRWATDLRIPGLRSWSLTQHPHTLFYLDGTEHIDLLRMLHHRQDISPAFTVTPR